VKKLNAIYEELTATKEKMKEALEKEFLLDSRVLVKLHCNQSSLTEGTVIAHDGKGYVRVRMKTAKEAVRSVFYTDVF